MEKYLKNGIEFIKCVNLSGKPFLVAWKNGYNIVGSVGESEDAIAAIYERLGV